MKINTEKIKVKLKKILQFLFNPRLLLCVFIAWMITNGWCYVFLALGSFFKIHWMTVVGGIYAGALWTPFTPEKILTLILAIFFLKTFFPDDTKTLKVLHDDLEAGKKKFKEFMNRKKKQ